MRWGWVLAAILTAVTTFGVAYWTGRPRELVVTVPSIGESGQTQDLDMGRIETHIRALSATSSRVTGYPGSEQALAYIQAQLRELGVTDTQVQPFEVPVPIVESASLEATLDGAAITIPLHPLWPNLARTPQTAPAGLTGPLVNGGRGSDADLAGKRLLAGIVVIDWDSRVEWLSVPEFGGQAVVFRANPAAGAAEARSRFLTVPGDIPRYYVDATQLERLDALLARAAGQPVTIRCQTAWRPCRTANLLARVSAGTGQPGDDDPDHAPVIFHAYYDSISVTPDLSPGAEQACGPATLLELGRFLQQHKPARPVYLLFTGGHGQALQGMTRFVRTVKDGLAEDWATSQGTLLANLGQPGLFVGLDITSHSERFGVFCCGRFRSQYEGRLRPKFSTLGLKLDEYAKSCTPDFDSKTELPGFVDCINLTLGRGWWTYFPYQAPFESEIPNLAAFPGITLSTINDARRYVDTPDDRVENVRLDMLSRQLLCEPRKRVGLANIALALALWEGPFASTQLDDNLARLRGRVAWLDQERNYTPNEPLDQATVFLKAQRGDKYLCGTRGTPVTMTNAQGEFEFDGLVESAANGEFSRCLVEAYGTADRHFVDANPAALGEFHKARQRSGGQERSLVLDGAIIYAVDMARARDYPWQVQMRKRDENLNLVAFPCGAITLYGLTDPREYLDLKDIQILDVSTQSPPFQFGNSTTDAYWGNPEENCIAIWADLSLRVRITLGFGYQTKRLILVNSTPENPVGSGYALEELETIPSMILQGASDMWNLDESRVTRLEKHGVNNPRVRRLHLEAQENLSVARTALEQGDYRTYHSTSEKAWGLESKAYEELLATTNNMIRGVLFYLALLLPFSYCLERLLLASGTIRRRITGMALIFLASFVLLACVHPAFRFTMTPMIVLLAFVILALAGTVSFLVAGRFDTMLQERKHETAGLHEDTANVSNIAVRAVDLGIANIRRRRQRGFLTGATIVAVMFTLLSFISIVPELSISKLRHPEGESTYKGLLARDRNWQPLRSPVYDSVVRYFQDKPGAKGRGVVSARGWFFSDYGGRLSQIDLSPAPEAEGGERSTTPATAATAAGQSGFFTAVALLCMEPTEPQVTGIDQALVAGRWFRDPDDMGVILPEHVAKCLGLGPADLGRHVLVFGRRLPLIGVLDAAKADAIHDLDGESLTPVNFVLQQQEAAKRASVQDQADTLEDYVHYPIDQMAIVPLKFGRQLGATLRSIGIRTREDLSAMAEAEGIARRSSQTILACDGGPVTLFASVSGSKLSAAGQIAVPLMLGFLMVLGTMLGSVYERRREIFVYNSVGLSPTHVASLFLAESSVYAIVGASLGYLLGQVVSKLLLVTGALSGLSLNYSAGATVFVTALTMLIVLLSTVYPARQAFLAAIPEERADSTLSEDQFAADRISLFLPFVCTPANIMAMQAYMYEFLDSVQGVTVGQLAVDGLRPECETVDGRPAPTLRFRAWLAPFDLGISHDARLRIVFRPDRGVYQYHLTATRYSGDHQSWKRLTPRFILTLRKQLLIWRILSAAAHRRYAETGERLFGAAPAEDAAATAAADVAAPAPAATTGPA